MFLTERFGHYMTGQIQSWSHPNMYIICYEQGDISRGDMFYVDRADDIERNVLGDVWGVVGWCCDYMNPGRVFKGGVSVEYVLLDYTTYMKRECAAMRIQRTWRRIRKQKALDVIIPAWRNYLVKKNELWNLRCFVGVAYLHIEAVRASREAVGVM